MRTVLCMSCMCTCVNVCVQLKRRKIAVLNVKRCFSVLCLVSCPQLTVLCFGVVFLCVPLQVFDCVLCVNCFHKIPCV